MGFFDRLAGKASPTPAGTAAAGAPLEPSVSGVAPRLIAARERLDAKDLPGALAIYEEILAVAGERADVLVTVSGDLGTTGNIQQIIDLVAPRYDATRHGPATGINLIQAYLALRDADSARHVLDILSALQRPELGDRLNGFSNAIAELIQHGDIQGIPEPANYAGAQGSDEAPQPLGVALVTISRPMWSYGLEAFPEILPKKEGKLRRVAFAQLSLPGAYADLGLAMKQPEDELGRLSRGIPLWLAETFYFSPLYSSVAALGVVHEADGSRRPVIFSADWTVDNLKKLTETASDGLDYVFTGSLTREAGAYSLTLRVWDVRKFKERKQITATWTAETADAELKKLHEFVKAFMEWAPYPEGSSLPYVPPSSPIAWIDALAALLGLFLVEKKLLPKEQLPNLAQIFDSFAPHAFSPPSSSLSWILLRSKATALGLQPALAEVLLSSHPAVVRARTLIAS